MPAVYRGMPPEELQRQYSARAAVPEHPRIFERWQVSSEEHRVSARAELDVAYGSREREKLDLFLPPQPNEALALFIHGGYWQAMDKSYFSFLSRAFVGRRVAVAIMNYDLCPSVSLDEICAQAARATAWLHANAAGLGLDCRRFLLCGHSAGGHLAATLLSERWHAFSTGLPRCPATSALCLSGVFDLAPLRLTAMNNALGLDEEAARRNSPCFSLPATEARLACAVGGEESDEFHRQSRDFAQAWGAHGLHTSYDPIPGCNHFTLLEELADQESRLFRLALELAQGE